MKRFSFGSLRIRLILLVLLAVIPALGITLYSGLERRGQERQRALDDALRLAQDISETHDRLIQNARQVLFTLSKISEVQQQDKAACSKTFADIVKQSQGYTSLFAVKPNGDIFASSIPITHPVNFADRPWFKRLLKTRDFVIGKYLIGRVSGKPLIVLAHPVLDGMGNLKAVLVWGMDLEWLNQVVVKSKLQEGTSVTVIDSDGTVLFRYPEPEKFVGKSMPEVPIVKAILAKREGVEETIGPSGVPRLFGFTSLGKGVESVHVSVGIPKQIALAKADRVIKDNLAYLGLIALLALAAAWFMGGFIVVHPVNRLLEKTKQLANGDLTARTGPPYKQGEIGQLARVFDQMATSLEQREAERRRAEGALLESEALFRDIALSISDWVWELDIQGRYVYCSEKVEGVLGYTHEEILGKTPFDLMSPDEAARISGIFEEIVKNQESIVDLENWNLHRDGRKVCLLTNGVPMFDKRGQLIGYRGVDKDITERKRAEEALRASEKRFRELFDGAPVGYHEIDKEGKITRVNRTELDVLGYTAEEVVGRYVYEFVTEEISPQSIKGKLAGVLPIGATFERTYLKKDGTAIPVLIEEKLIKDNEGRIVGIRSTIQDITGLKKAEEEKAVLQEQLRQSQKIEAIGRLAGGIAHDFNNLLTVIKGYSQLSLHELKEDVPLRENIEEIKRAAERAADLTRQLLAFSRRQILEMKVLDLNTILRDMDKMLHRLIGEDIELITLLADDLGGVKTDPGWVEQIIMNLAVNARDAMPSVGKLTIETANVELDEHYARAHVAVTPGRYTMLSVSDTGVGMPPEIRDKVFEPFFTTKEKGTGTGLGLSTVYGIVKQSGGNIWVYSEPGHGTTFKIYLPRVDEPLEEIKERVVKEELPRGSETILIVEDEEDVLKLAARILERQGYTVLQTSSTSKALEICKEQKNPIHLILTDVVMPQMSGRELADRIVSIHPEIKVLYMSGYTDNAIVHHGVLEEGINFMQKPFTLEILSRKVREALNESQ